MTGATTETEHTIEGTCAPAFTAVRDLFAARADDLGEGGGAFCAHVGSEKVVDLWAGWAKPGIAWTDDTLVVLASATKGMATLVAQVLYSRGELDIEAPVASYWPEFAANGKEKITVRHVLTHTAGVIDVPGHERFMRWDGTGWDDYERISSCIAAAAPAWEPGTKVGYHALTFGWLIGEIVRRITLRSCGRLFADEIAGPLGLDAYIGTPPSAIGRVADMIADDGSHIRNASRDPTTLAGRAGLATHDGSLADADDRTPEQQARFLGYEQPASNGTSTAASLATMYAVLANGGALDGVALVSRASIGVFCEEIEDIPQAGVSPMMELRRALGYHGNFAPFGSPGVFGHVGGGGQFGGFDPEQNVAFGFVRSHRSNTSTLALELIQAVYDALSS